MKDLQIIISCNQQEVGVADFLDVKTGPSKNTSQISFENFRPSGALELTRHSIQNIVIKYKQKVRDYFEVKLLQGISFTDDNRLYLICDFNPEQHHYEQDLINLLKAWDNNTGKGWQGLNTRDKRTWLTGCLYYSGIPRETKKNRTYIIDGLRVDNELDFYCLLGEVFFGSRGYFGQGIESFEDCLLEMRPAEGHGSKIVFTSSRRIRSALNTYYPDEFDRVCTIFRKFGFDTFITHDD